LFQSFFEEQVENEIGKNECIDINWKIIASCLLSDVSCYNKFIFMEMENKNLKGA
jgi:hypothetical protein